MKARSSTTVAIVHAVCLWALLAPGTASAQNHQSQAASATHFEEAKSRLEDGKNALRSKDFQKAERLFQTAFERYPDPIALYYKGLAQLRQNKCEPAERHFKKALSHEMGLGKEATTKANQALGKVGECRERASKETTDRTPNTTSEADSPDPTSQTSEKDESADRKLVAGVTFEKPHHTRGAGSIEVGSIRDTLRKSSDDILTCYRRRLEDNSEVSGKITVKFTLDQSGGVTLARAAANLVGGDTGRCVAQTINSLDFPAPSGGTVFLVQSMTFDQKADPAEAQEAEGRDNSDGSASSSSAENEQVVNTSPEVIIGKTLQTRGAGRLDLAPVETVVRDATEKLESCYKRRLADDPTADGSVVVGFTIETSGSVSLARPTNDSVGGNVGDCVAETIEKLQFPSPKDGSVFLNQRMEFKPPN